MKLKRHNSPPMKTTVSLIALSLTLGVYAEEATPGYNHKIPEKIMTPDTVETSIGTLEFFDGMPKPDTVDLLYSNLFRNRATETFLSGIPATSIEGLLEGMESLGADTSNKVVVFDKVMENEDGSVTLYFGPSAPAGKESNWIQTVPKKGWFTIPRLYGPLEPWFNKSWKPGEIELVK